MVLSCDNYSLLHFNRYSSVQEPEVWKEVCVEMNRGENRGDYKCRGQDLRKGCSVFRFLSKALAESSGEDTGNSFVSLIL